MPIALPVRSTIFQAILDEIKDTLPDANTGEGEPFWVLAQIISTAVWSVFQPVAYVAEQIFPSSSASEYLVRHGAARKIPRKGASGAQGYALLSGVAGSTQAAGTQFADSSGQSYVADSGVTLAVPGWNPTTIAAFDTRYRDRFIATSTVNMNPGDTFTVAGQTFCIKDLPGGTSVIIYGVINFDNPVNFAVVPISGARIPITSLQESASANLPYGSTLSVSAPGTGVAAAAYVLEMAGGADIETEPAWANRIEDVMAEYPAGGNRSQLLGWALGLSTKEERDRNAQKLYALGVDQAFVYPLFRGLGTSDISVRGVKGARHLSSQRIAAIQNYIYPATPTDDNPGMVAPGADIRVNDTIDQLQAVEIAIVGGTGFAPDWTVPFYTTAAGSTQLRVNTTTSPVGKVRPGSRIVLTLPNGKLVMTRTSNVDATGFNVNPPLDLPPANGVTIYPGSDLIEPVRDAIYEMFDTLGPGDTVPRPSRFPAPSTEFPCNLNRALIDKVVMSVKGVGNVGIVTPPGDVTAVAQSVITLNGLIITHLPA